jgi:hypothetical protein
MNCVETSRTIRTFLELQTLQYSPGQTEGNTKKIRVQVKRTEIQTRYFGTQFH